MIANQGPRFGQHALAVVLLCAFIVWIGTPLAVAGPITFAKIARESDLAPGGLFSSGFGIPAIDTGLVAFTGYQVSPGPNPQRGVYSYSAGLLQRVAAVGDAAQASGLYTDFSTDAPSVDSGRVGFLAVTTAGQGIFLADNGTPHLMVRQGYAAPAIGGTFSALYAPSFSGNSFVFAADDSLVPVGHAGIFEDRNGLFTPIVLQGFAKPGGGHFADFDVAPAISGNTVAFLADGSGFKFRNGLTSIVALAMHTHAPPVAAAGLFSGLADVTIDGGRIGFRGDTDSGQQGIYVAEGPTISVVVQKGAVRPRTLDFFSDFGNVSLSQGNLAFYGAAGASQGIYFETGNALSRVIGTGDVLDGRTIASVAFGSHGLSGDELVFGVTFSDESQAIYLADVSALEPAVPEPASVILLAVGGTGLLARRGYRRYLLTT